MTGHVSYAGGSLPTLDQSTCHGACDPAETIQVTLMLRRRNQHALDALVRRIGRGESNVKPMTRKAFARRFGTSAADLYAVRAYARQHGFSVVRVDSVAGMAVLSGTVAQFEAAFQVTLQQYEAPGWGRYRGHAETLSLPESLHGVATAVLGLDTRPAARTHFRIRPRPGAATPGNSYTPPEVASIYGFPAGDGSGECIALIELGGGYSAADVARYFESLGLRQRPTLVDVGVKGGANAPTGDPSGPDGEVSLDIEVAGAIAPGATIAVYFAPNSTDGFIAAVNQAIHDQANHPSVVSISWGGPEDTWPAQAMQAFDQVLQTAAVLGVTICVASGDGGSSDGESDGANHVDFPASSAYVLACGGTRLDPVSGGGASETAWNDADGGATGGGVSGVFELPQWQQNLSVTLTRDGAQPLAGRGVPDVAGDASPESGYQVSIDGAPAVVGGTSAVAPLWAALVARLNASSGRALGWLNPVLYANPSAMRDVSRGNNGSYGAASGWDACTGLGSPNGARLEAVVQQAA